MLTQDQKSKLEPLTHHEKYGKLLIQAIETWETVKPGIESFGADRFDGETWFANWRLSPYENCCCLVGAAIIGQNASESFTETAARMCNVTREEIWQVIYGFDSTKTNNESEAWLFGKTVSDIVFGKEE